VRAPLDPDEQLAEILALQHPDERLGRVLQAVHEVLVRLTA
jgi:hypothetical protein